MSAVSFLFIVGVLLAVVGGLWLLVVGFQTSILWGIGMLLLPIIGLIFVFLHWQQAKSPFLLQVVGVVLIFAGGAADSASIGPLER